MARPLDGVRVLAAEQMQALPYATQLLARLGADVVKVEPLGGESGRGPQPAMLDPEGRSVGATFQLGTMFGVSRCGRIEKTSLISLRAFCPWSNARHR